MDGSTLIPARATAWPAGGGVGLGGGGATLGVGFEVAVGVAPSPGVGVAVTAGVAEARGVEPPGRFGVGLEPLCEVGVDLALALGDPDAPGVAPATSAPSGAGVGLELEVCRATAAEWGRSGPANKPMPTSSAAVTRIATQDRG